MSDNIMELKARLVHQTEKARLLDFGGAEPVWLPKSQHEWDEAAGTVTLPERIAFDKGLV